MSDRDDMREVYRYRNRSGVLVTVKRSEDGERELLQTWPRDHEPPPPLAKGPWGAPEYELTVNLGDKK